MTASSLTPAEWVIETLKATSAIAAAVDSRIYRNQIPNQAHPVFPYIVVTKVPGEPVTNASADIIMMNDLVDVDIWDQQADDESVGLLLDQVITTLHKANGNAIRGGVVICCTFEGEVPQEPEIEGLTIYQHKLGEFRVYSQ